MAMDTDVLVKVIGAGEAFGAVVDWALEGLFEGMDGADVALEVF
jgi:hypothetical protein